MSNDRMQISASPGIRGLQKTKMKSKPSRFLFPTAASLARNPRSPSMNGRRKLVRLEISVCIDELQFHFFLNFSRVPGSASIQVVMTEGFRVEASINQCSNSAFHCFFHFASFHFRLKSLFFSKIRGIVKIRFLEDLKSQFFGMPLSFF